MRNGAYTIIALRDTMLQLTAKEAWQKIAEAFDRFATSQPIEFPTTGELAYSGLCYAITRLYEADAITTRTYLDMHSQLLAVRDTHADMTGERHHGWWWPTDPMGAAERAVMATMLAEELS